jgi:hypothetical protein
LQLLRLLPGGASGISASRLVTLGRRPHHKRPKALAKQGAAGHSTEQAEPQQVASHSHPCQFRRSVKLRISAAEPGTNYLCLNARSRRRNGRRSIGLSATHRIYAVAAHLHGSDVIQKVSIHCQLSRQLRKGCTEQEHRDEGTSRDRLQTLSNPGADRKSPRDCVLAETNANQQPTQPKQP